MDAAFSTLKYRKLQPWVAMILPLVLVGGWFFYPPLGIFIVVCMLMAIGISFIKGRYWCDWMCPRGSFLDAYLEPFSLKKEMPQFFYHWAFRLFILVVLMAILAWRLPSAWGNWDQVGFVFLILLTVTTFVGIILGLVYQQRIWCMFCPMGTLASILGKNKYPLKIISQNCTGCKRCNDVCRMEIKPDKYREKGLVNNGDCLKCGYCIEACPKNALKFEKASKKEVSFSTKMKESNFYKKT